MCKCVKTVVLHSLVLVSLTKLVFSGSPTHTLAGDMYIYIYIYGSPPDQNKAVYREFFPCRRKISAEAFEAAAESSMLNLGSAAWL